MHITFRNITVKYSDNRTILRNVCFEIPTGKRVALIGPSGAGKSTIGSLVRRHRDPTSGTVLINDIPLPDYNLSSLLAHIGVILQRPEIVSGDIRENLLLTIPKRNMGDISDEDLWNIIDLVSPEMRNRFGVKGLDTLVGKQGLQLSGGEQQRLCVMRALAKKPEFLLIDEATSALDSETEASVQAGIDTALRQGISALVIAHRFSTLKNCDQFVVLRKLSECKPHESQIETISDSLTKLYSESATFKRLADLQSFQP